MVTTRIHQPLQRRVLYVVVLFDLFMFVYVPQMFSAQRPLQVVAAHVCVCVCAISALPLHALVV